MSDRRWWELGKDSFDLSGVDVDAWVEAFDGALTFTFDAGPAKVTCCCGALGENLIDWAGWRPAARQEIYVRGDGGRFKRGHGLPCSHDAESWRDQEWLCDTCYRWLMGFFARG